MAEVESTVAESVETSDSIITRVLFFTVFGILVGIAVYYLGEAIEGRTAENKPIIALITFITTAALAWWLTTTPQTRLASALFGVLLAAVIAGLYLLSEVTFGLDFRSEVPRRLLFICGTTIFVIAVPFFRTRFERRLSVFHYPSLFEFAWNGPVIVAAAAAFTGVFWLVLLLWAALFDLIDISFFRELFREQIFARAATAGAFATAIGILRSRERIILTLRGVLFALLHVLTPILAVAVTLFVVALPFTGLEPLIETGQPLGVIIWVGLGSLILINAVLGDGEKDGSQSLLLTLPARLLGFLLPVHVALAAYVLVERTTGDGLTVATVHLSVVLAILACHAVVYFIAGFLPVWAAVIRRANVIIAGLTILVAALVQTPLVDPYEWTVQDMLARLRDGRVSAAEFDYGRLRFDLGKAGAAGLERLRTDTTFPDHDVVLEQLAVLDGLKNRYQWRNLARNREGRVWKADELIDQFVILQDGIGPLPDGLRARLMEERTRLEDCARRKGQICRLVAGDIQGDGGLEYLLLSYNAENRLYLSLTVFFRTENDAWDIFANGNVSESDAGDLRAALEAGDIRFEPLPYRVPVIGGQTVLIERPKP